MASGSPGIKRQKVGRLPGNNGRMSRAQLRRIRNQREYTSTRQRRNAAVYSF